MTTRRAATLSIIATLLLSKLALAQTPTPLYTGNVGGGFALTGGNSVTRNYNLSAAITRDPKTRNVMKGSMAYLRGIQSDVVNLDRAQFSLRDEYTLTGRTFVFGELDYLRDRFKEIIFLWVPSAGLGYKLINTDATQLILDGSAGGLLEKNPGFATTKTGSLLAGQRLMRKLSPGTTLLEALTTVWKTNEFEDSLTNFTASLTTTLVGKLELKLEFIDTYKNVPVNVNLKKNDTAFLTAFVMKF